jgi:hypothetical protein
MGPQSIAFDASEGRASILYGRTKRADCRCSSGTWRCGAAREWTATITGDQIVELDQLVPLWTAPGNEDIQVLAHKLFSDPGAPMSVSGMLTAGYPAADLLRSPLLINPTFRESVLAGLERTEGMGTAERLPDGALEVKAAGANMWVGPGIGPQRTPGKRNIRFGDFIAWQLSQIDGFPKFDIEWTTEEKDRSIATIADFFRTHAADLRAPDAITNPLPVPAVSLIRR